MTSKAVKQGAEALILAEFRQRRDVTQKVEAVLSTEAVQEVLRLLAGVHRNHHPYGKGCLVDGCPYVAALAAFQDEAGDSHTDAQGEG